MKRADITELHYICRIENIRSIMDTGILSHRRAQAIPHGSIAMEQVQAIRRTKRVPGARPLHEYVNLYIHARNPMMYKRSDQHRDLCVLRVSPAVLDKPGVVISDRNAAATYARFGPSPRALALIDAERVFAEYWTHYDDPVDEALHRAQKCAEVLVPDKVASVHIVGAYVSCDESRRTLAETAPGLPVTVDPHLFFQREGSW